MVIPRSVLTAAMIAACFSLAAMPLTATNDAGAATPPATQPQPQRDEDAPAVDPEARDLLVRTRDVLARAESLSARIAVVTRMRGPAMRHEHESRFDFALQRPNKFALVLTEGITPHESVVSDGDHLYSYTPLLKRYTKQSAPTDIKAILDPGGADPPAGALMPIGPLLFAGSLLSAGEAGSHVQLEQATIRGVEPIEGVETRRLTLTLGMPAIEMVDDEPHLRTEPMEVELWIEDGAQPLVRQIKLDLTPMMRAADAAAGNNGAPPPVADLMRDAEFEYLIRFDGWEVNPELPADRFKFTPPPGATEAEPDSR